MSAKIPPIAPPPDLRSYCVRFQGFRLDLPTRIIDVSGSKPPTVIAGGRAAYVPAGPGIALTIQFEPAFFGMSPHWLVSNLGSHPITVSPIATSSASAAPITIGAHRLSYVVMCSSGPIPVNFPQSREIPPGDCVLTSGGQTFSLHLPDPRAYASPRRMATKAVSGGPWAWLRALSPHIPTVPSLDVAGAARDLLRIGVEGTFAPTAEQSAHPVLHRFAGCTPRELAYWAGTAVDPSVQTSAASSASS